MDAAQLSGEYTVAVVEAESVPREKEYEPKDMPVDEDLRKVMDVRLEQPENALYPMDVTESGMVMEASEVHRRNTVFPMVVTELPMVTDASDVH